MNLTELLDKYGYPTRNKTEDEMIQILDNCLYFNSLYLSEKILDKEIKELGTEQLTDSQIEQINLVISDYHEEPIASIKELFSLLSEWGQKVNLNGKNMLDSEFWQTYEKIIARYELPNFLNDGKAHLLNLIRDLAMSNQQLNFQMKREEDTFKNKVKNFKMFLYFVSECLDHRGLTHSERNGIMSLLKCKIEAFHHVLDFAGDEF